jgi:hypothetical protein
LGQKGAFVKKYQASSPDALVSGLALLPLFLGLFTDDYAPILERMGLAADALEEWYPQQFVLDVLKAVQDSMRNQLVLVSVGLKWAGDLPPEFDHFPEFLDLLGDIYEASSLDLGEGDALRVRWIDPCFCQITNSTPYPDDLIYGYLYGNAQRYATKVSLKYKDGFLVNGSGNMIYEMIIAA